MPARSRAALIATPPRSAAGEVLQRAEQPAHRGAGAADDDRAGHGASSAGPPPLATVSVAQTRVGLLTRIGRPVNDATRRRARPPGVRRATSDVTSRDVCAAGCPRDQRPGPACPASCSPRSTTSASPSRTWTRRSPSTPRPSACSRCTRRPTRSRASARRCSPSATATTRIQLLAPLTPESTIAKFIGRSGPGLQQLAFRGRGRRGGQRDPARARPPAALRRPRARHGRQPRQLRPPQGRRRRAGRARRAGRDWRTDHRAAARRCSTAGPGDNGVRWQMPPSLTSTWSW